MRPGMASRKVDHDFLMGTPSVVSDVVVSSAGYSSSLVGSPREWGGAEAGGGAVQGLGQS